MVVAESNEDLSADHAGPGFAVWATLRSNDTYTTEEHTRLPQPQRGFVKKYPQAIDIMRSSSA